MSVTTKAGKFFNRYFSFTFIRGRCGFWEKNHAFLNTFSFLFLFFLVFWKCGVAVCSAYWRRWGGWHATVYCTSQSSNSEETRGAFPETPTRSAVVPISINLPTPTLFSGAPPRLNSLLQRLCCRLTLSVRSPSQRRSHRSHQAWLSCHLCLWKQTRRIHLLPISRLWTPYCRFVEA